MASERWKNDTAYAMTPFKLLTWPIGIWPLQTYNIHSLIRFIFATCCMSILVVLPSMEFHMGCTNAEQKIDGLMLACCGILGVLKSICFRIYAKNLTDNYGSALNDYLTIENTEHRAIMRRHSVIGRIVSCFMVLFSYVSVTIYSLIPLLGEELADDQDHIKIINVTNEDVLDYPIPSGCALEYLHVPISMYKFTCLLEFIVLVLTCTANHGNDALFLNITIHMCGQVQILKTNFMDLASDPQVYDRFNTLIQRHNYLMELGKKLDESISIVLVTQLFISSILLCIMGFQFILALKMNNIVVMGKSCMVLCTFLTQLSVYSFVGDYFKNQMEEVGLSIYQSNWYNLPAKLARNLIFAIMRTQSPVKLQAGNFIVNIYGNTWYMAAAKEDDIHDNPMDLGNICAGNGIIVSCHHSSSCVWNSLKILVTLVENDKESYKIMKRHASKSRLCTLCMLYSAYICGSLYILTVIFINLKGFFLQDQMMNASNGNVSTDDRVFIMPCGLRIIFCLKNGEYVDLTKTVMLLNYMLLESLIYCYGGDFIQKGSEGIFHAMFMASWFTLPATLMKDFNFAMMRSSYPFRLTGGKFFYVNREAIVKEYFARGKKRRPTIQNIIVQFVIDCKHLYAGTTALYIENGVHYRTFQRCAVDTNLSYHLSYYPKGWSLRKDLMRIHDSNFLQSKSKASTRATRHARLQFSFLRSKPANTSLNMRTNWNSGIDYGFSTIKSMMWILGLWPLQRDNVVYTIQWFIMFTAASLTMINVLIEPFKTCDAVRDGFEILRLTESSIHGWLNIIFPRIYMKKIAVNINAAINDWSSTAIKKESRVVMMAYARTGRLIALTHLIVGALAGILWYISVFLSNKQEAATVGNDTVTTWNFVLPSTCLYKGVSYFTYKILFTMQIIQGILILISECACDSLFFSITMHICGQLQLLKIQFMEISKKCREEKCHANVLKPFVKRHCQLIVLARNIEDAFSINILLRLLIISVVIAASGIGTLLSIKQQDYKEMIKMLISIQFYMVQTFLYTYAGDMLQNRSESIVYAIYSSPWHEMSSVMVKDLIFIMTRMKNPLRISAGKFFYLTRNTMTDILRTTLTYISFLQVTMNKKFLQ
ncbi:PREDICTED: uncharacterized protein LOC105568083 [Vollenhovia emeryi]|uniref:uncharacterized protein LOC105568083 n=1 Tax=Vollenhovia emeryi TaxID=411798 RepID=UPI0005F40CB1|nr:PREDICTED: uncharacterized protein LOC105568083 [Vollenhovia emeryi]